MKNSVKTESGIYRGLSIFTKVMSGQPVTGISDLIYILHATMDIALMGHDYLHSGRGSIVRNDNNIVLHYATVTRERREKLHGHKKV